MLTAYVECGNISLRVLCKIVDFACAIMRMEAETVSIFDFLRDPVIGVIGLFAAFVIWLIKRLLDEYLGKGTIGNGVWKRTLKVFLISVLIVGLFIMTPVFLSRDGFPPQIDLTFFSDLTKKIDLTFFSDLTQRLEEMVKTIELPNHDDLKIDLFGTPAPTPTPSPAPTHVPYTFVNDAVERVVRKKLNRPLRMIYTDDLEGITELDLSGQFVNDLTDIAAMPHLTSLTISSDVVEKFEGWNARRVTLDLSPLSGLSQLRSLEIRGKFQDESRGTDEISVYRIGNLSPLSGLTQLKFLTLPNCEISDVSLLSGLTLLQSLDLSDNKISDAVPLRGMKQLKTLILIRDRIVDLRPLSGLTQLQDLNLWCNYVSDVSPLSGLTQLRKLYLWGNQIRDVSPLSGLTKLQWLDLDSNRISDVGSLSGLIQLEHLELQNNQISDVSPLSGLTKLKELYLNINRISDVGPLSGLTQLERLELQNNQISDVRPLSGLTKLQTLFIYENNIKDTSPVSFVPELK